MPMRDGHYRSRNPAGAFHPTALHVAVSRTPPFRYARNPLPPLATWPHRPDIAPPIWSRGGYSPARNDSLLPVRSLRLAGLVATGRYCVSGPVTHAADYQLLRASTSCMPLGGADLMYASK